MGTMIKWNMCFRSICLGTTGYSMLSRPGRQDESRRESDRATRLDAEQTKTSRGNSLTVIQ
jgi:hypothetical protein